MFVNPVVNYNLKIPSASAFGIKNNQSGGATTNNIEHAQSGASVSFGNFFTDIFIDKYKFSTDEEKAMYKELDSVLSGKDKTNFDILYKTGRLQDRNSNNNSSTLENLFAIYKNERIAGLDKGRILSDTIERLANPFVINQKFGILPKDVMSEVLAQKAPLVASGNAAKNEPKTEGDMYVENSASCVAASIEFSLADKKPAEFARFVAGLSSPDMKVVQNVKLSCLNKNQMDAIHLLSIFNVKVDNPSWTSTDIAIAPDRDAIIRARVQNTYGDANSRSPVDVLLQSAFMQLGSQNTYNSLTDKRYGSLNANDTGLTEFEKTFVESVVGNDGEKTSMVYQNVNDNSILEGYYHPEETVKQHILSTLAKNRNVIIGITETDANKKIIGGHEITIVGYKMKDNELYFVCNDTDDDYVGAVEVSAKDLIPKIHHAGIPVDILPNAVTESDRGIELLKEYSSAA